jgi:hypothetical protein
MQNFTLLLVFLGFLSMREASCDPLSGAAPLEGSVSTSVVSPGANLESRQDAMMQPSAAESMPPQYSSLDANDTSAQDRIQTARLRLMRMFGQSASLNPQIVIEARSLRLEGSAQQELSLIGLCYDAFSGRVSQVLPGSDLYGSVFPGDRLVAEDGLDPLESWQQGHNFGPAGSVTQITFEGRKGLQTVSCHRKPVRELLAGMMLNGGLVNWSAIGR